MKPIIDAHDELIFKMVSTVGMKSFLATLIEAMLDDPKPVCWVKVEQPAALPA